VDVVESEEEEEEECAGDGGRGVTDSELSGMEGRKAVCEAKYWE